MADKSPAFQFYPDKALAGTFHLSDKAFRVYWNLLWWMWLNGPQQCSIRNAPATIRYALKLSKYVYANAFEKEIMNPDNPMLRVEGDFLISNGLRKEKRKQEARSEAALKGAKARWDKCKRISDASSKQCPPSLSLSPTTSTKKNKGTVDLNSWVEKIWKIWPKKSGKKEALPKIQDAIKDLSKTHDNPGAYLLSRVEAFAASDKGRGPKNFIKDPVRWFRAAHYDDDPQTWKDDSVRQQNNFQRAEPQDLNDVG